MQGNQTDDSSDDSPTNARHWGDMREYLTLEEKEKQRKTDKNKVHEQQHIHLPCHVSPHSSQHAVPCEDNIRTNRQYGSQGSLCQAIAPGGIQVTESSSSQVPFTLRQSGETLVGQPDQMSLRMGQSGQTQLGVVQGQPCQVPFWTGQGQSGQTPFGMGRGQPCQVKFWTGQGQPGQQPFGMGQGQPGQQPFGIGQGQPGQQPFGIGQGQLGPRQVGVGHGQHCEIPVATGGFCQSQLGMGQSGQMPVGMGYPGGMSLGMGQQQQAAFQHDVPTSINGYQPIYTYRPSPYQFPYYPFMDSTSNNSHLVHPNWIYSQIEEMQKLREQVSFLQNIVLQPTTNSGEPFASASSYPSHFGQQGSAAVTSTSFFPPGELPTATFTAVQTPSSDIRKASREKEDSKKKINKKKKKKRKNFSKVTCKLDSPGGLSSSGDSDSEDDNQCRRTIGKRVRCFSPYSETTRTSTFTNPIVESSQHQGGHPAEANSEMGIDEPPLEITEMQMENCELKEYKNAAKKYQENPNVLLWKQVAEEHQMTEAAEQMDMITVVDKFIINRGPESYVVGNKRKRPDPAVIRKEADKAAEESDGEYATDSSVSSACFSDSTKDHIRERVKAVKVAKAAKPVGEKWSKTGQQLMKEKIAQIDDASLPYFIAKTLREENSKWHIFVRTMTVFGREFMKATFLKTLKVERRGGIMIKNMKRRRTPGGAFIYMVRNDRRLSQADRDAVFDYDRNEALEAKRADKIYQKEMMFESMRKKMSATPNFEDEIAINGGQETGIITDVEKQTTEDIFKEDELKNSYPIPKNMLCMTHGNRQLIKYDDLE